ncbi:MAG: transcription termination factor NusA [Elusimicrobia bacterium]|mgnify:CR=1 FL=1|nr:transcription termination factor NusA [Elusimicrobiota bacterium]
MNKELIALFDYWEKEKGIDKEFLLSALESGLLTVYRKKANLDENISIKIDPETGDLRFLDEKGKVIPPPSFPWERIIAQTAKHVIMQRLKEAEKSTVYNEFSDLEGTMISGRVERFEDNNIVVSLGKAEALLPHFHKLDSDYFKVGHPINAYILEVRKPNKGIYQIILSRTHPDFVRRLLEKEIPEIADGSVNIKDIARFPGDLVKVAVSSTLPKIDPVGTCLGEKAGRIKNIMRELSGEKAEIILWDKDISKYILNSLSPAKGKKVILNEKKKIATVIVEDSQVFLAVGKRGQNVRLASKLTGWDIRIIRESEHEGPDKPAISVIEGIDEKIITELAKNGYNSIKSLADADIETLTKIPSIDEETAELLITKAKQYREQPKKDNNESKRPGKEV